jgi:hypothetical protein
MQETQVKANGLLGRDKRSRIIGKALGSREGQSSLTDDAQGFTIAKQSGAHRLRLFGESVRRKLGVSGRRDNLLFMLHSTCFYGDICNHKSLGHILFAVLNLTKISADFSQKSIMNVKDV